MISALYLVAKVFLSLSENASRNVQTMMTKDEGARHCNKTDVLDMQCDTHEEQQTFVGLSTCLSVRLSIYLSVSQSVYFSVCLSVLCLSVFLLSVCLSVYI